MNMNSPINEEVEIVPAGVLLYKPALSSAIYIHLLNIVTCDILWTDFRSYILYSKITIVNFLFLVYINLNNY